MVYFDSAYIAKCYLNEAGTDAVLDLAEASEGRTSVALAQVEVEAVFYRHLRENRLDRTSYLAVCNQFEADQSQGIWRWLPLTPKIIEGAATRFRELEGGIFLRTADCIHLTAARRAGFNEIYSNDRHLLAAAPSFGLKGHNVIAA